MRQTIAPHGDRTPASARQVGLGGGDKRCAISRRADYNYDYNGISVMDVVDFTTEEPKLVHEAFRQAENPRR